MTAEAQQAIWLIGGIVFLASFILTPLVRRLAISQGWFDRPGDERRVHRVPTPRIGGIAMYIAFVLGVGLTFLPAPFAVNRDFNPTEPGKIALLLVGCTIMAGVMFVDDVWGLTAKPKLAWQFFATGIVMLPSLLHPSTWDPSPLPDYLQQKVGNTIATMDINPGVLVTAVQNPFTGDAFQFVRDFTKLFSSPVGPIIGVIVAAVFTFFWIMGMVNTINWMDGLDGLAAGITAIACVVLCAASLQQQQYSIAILPLILGAAVLGFLPFNFHPARIFMGDSGAMFIGFALGVLSIIGGAKIATALLVLGVPILDVAYVIIFRLIRGRSPLQADRGHLHHRLFDLGMTHRQVCMLYYFLCGGFGAVALLGSGYGLLKLATVGLMALLLAALLIFISRSQFDPQRIKRSARNS